MKAIRRHSSSAAAALAAIAVRSCAMAQVRVRDSARAIVAAWVADMGGGAGGLDDPTDAGGDAGTADRSPDDTSSRPARCVPAVQRRHRRRHCNDARC